MVSGDFESYGDPGPGRWVTIYANAGHVWMEVAGWRFDTVALAEGAPEGHPKDGFSEASMHVHHRWAQATTLIQIAIALAAITLLTRDSRLKYFSYAVAAGSLGLGVLAALHF